MRQGRLPREPQSPTLGLRWARDDRALRRLDPLEESAARASMVFDFARSCYALVLEGGVDERKDLTGA